MEKFSNEVIVKGLNFQANETEIKDFFNEKVGSVTRVNLIKGREGKSKGTAFVSFKTEEACNKAIAESNCDFMGRYLIIEKIHPKNEKPTNLLVDEESKTIFVGNLSFKIDNTDLREFFAPCGEVADVRIAYIFGKVLDVNIWIF